MGNIAEVDHAFHQGDRTRRHPNERCAKPKARARLVVTVFLGMATVSVLYYRELTRPAEYMLHGSQLSARLLVTDEKKFLLTITNQSEYPVVVSTDPWDYEVKLFDGQGNELTDLHGFTSQTCTYFGSRYSYLKLLKPGKECIARPKPVSLAGPLPVPQEAVRAVVRRGNSHYDPAVVYKRFGVPMAFLHDKPSVRLRGASW